MTGMENEQSFEESLRQCCFCHCLTGVTKDAVLVEMVDALAAAGRITDRGGVLDALRSREDQMSTGMQYGIALPHGKHASVQGLVTLIGLHPDGVDFESLDGIPSRIFVMTLSSTETIGQHLRFLAAIGRLLGRPAVREAVLKAGDKEAMIRALV